MTSQMEVEAAQSASAYPLQVLLVRIINRENNTVEAVLLKEKQTAGEDPVITFSLESASDTIVQRTRILLVIDTGDFEFFMASQFKKLYNPLQLITWPYELFYALITLDRVPIVCQSTLIRAVIADERTRYSFKLG